MGLLWRHFAQQIPAVLLSSVVHIGLSGLKRPSKLAYVARPVVGTTAGLAS